MAKRYGVLPSEFLKQDNWEFLFNLFCAKEATEHEARERRRAESRRITRGG